MPTYREPLYNANGDNLDEYSSRPEDLDELDRRIIARSDRTEALTRQEAYERALREGLAREEVYRAAREVERRARLREQERDRRAQQRAAEWGDAVHDLVRTTNAGIADATAIPQDLLVFNADAATTGRLRTSIPFDVKVSEALKEASDADLEGFIRVAQHFGPNNYLHGEIAHIQGELDTRRKGREGLWDHLED